MAFDSDLKYPLSLDLTANTRTYAPGGSPNRRCFSVGREGRGSVARSIRLTESTERVS